jgi:hypothetical protein
MRDSLNTMFSVRLSLQRYCKYNILRNNEQGNLTIGCLFIRYRLIGLILANLNDYQLTVNSGI